MLPPTTSLHSVHILIDSKLSYQKECYFISLKLRINDSCVGLRLRRLRWMAHLAWCLLATAYHLDTETILIFLCGILFINPKFSSFLSVLHLPLFSFFFFWFLACPLCQICYLYIIIHFRPSLFVLFYSVISSLQHSMIVSPLINA